MKSRKRLIRLLESVPETQDLVALYFDEERTGKNVMATIAAKMAPYEFVAAAWSQASEKISLTEWLNDEFILVLGNDEEHRAALNAINRVLFKRLTELILAQSESDTRRTWIFLDEAREAGDLEGLGRLMTTGRSKGACVVLGFQDIDGFRDAYGEKAANEIAGIPSNKAILGLSSPETAEWASSLFGEYEATEVEVTLSSGSSEAIGESKTQGDSHTTNSNQTKGTSETVSLTRTEGRARNLGGSVSESSSYSHGRSSGANPLMTNWNWNRGQQASEAQNWSDAWNWSTAEGSSRGINQSTSDGMSRARSNSVSASKTVTNTAGDSAAYKKVKGAAVMASEFLSLPMTTRKHGMTGFFLVPAIDGAFSAWISGDALETELVPKNEKEPNLLPRPIDEQYLKPWDESDLRRLGFPSEETREMTF